MIPRRFGWHAALAAGLIPGLGCIVKFDGYKLEETPDASDGGDEAGGASGAGARGGAPSGGVSSGGTSSGGTGGKGGTSGASPTGGAGPSGGASGSTTGGAAPTGGDAGTSGSPTGGMAGSTTTGGTSGMGGRGGSAGMGGRGGSAGSSGAGGSGGMVSCPATGRGPAMIEIPAPDGGIFCIDRSEVTNAMYDVFLADGPRVADQGAPCTWNMNFAPETGSACSPLPTAMPNTPVACIDWCDARMFCEWAGKHLCGAVGGGPSPLSSFDDPATNEWYRTCSHNDDRALPYGDTYQGSFCAGLDYGTVRPVNVATLANCQGGYDGVWDMSGNVSEWEDSCQASSGASDNCAHRGGAWYDLKAGAPLYCNSSLPSDTTPMPEVLRRDTRDIHVGFRCCADP